MLFSPFSRKIHNSCRDYCCRKKKFNRSIDPTIQNAVAAVFRHNSFAPSRTQSSSTDNAAGVLVTSSTLSSSSPLSSSSSMSHAQPARQSPRRHCGGSAVNVRIEKHKKSYIIQRGGGGGNWCAFSPSIGCCGCDALCGRNALLGEVREERELTVCKTIKYLKYFHLGTLSY